MSEKKISGNSNGTRPLKRMKLSYKNISIQFAINPEDYTQSEPSKSIVTQTKGGAWIDAWGAGLLNITLKGITGVKGHTKSIDTGYERWRELRDLFRQVYADAIDGANITDLIKLYNFTDNEYWYCYPNQNGIELYRSKSRPHVYQYSLNLLGLRPIGKPIGESGVIGNPYKKQEKGKQVTSKNQKVTHTGGNSYTTINGNINKEVDYQTKTTTKSKSDNSIIEECELYCNELETLIGAFKGKLIPVTAYGCSTGLDIQSSGTIANIKPFIGTDLTDEDTIIAIETRFTPRVSSQTYKLQKSIKEYSPEVLSSNFTNLIGLTPKQKIVNSLNSQYYGSMLYKYLVEYKNKSILTLQEIYQIKSILLETFTIYLDLYNLKSTLKTNITNLTLTTLINNIRAIIFEMGVNNEKLDYHKRVNISKELRAIEFILIQVKTYIIDYL